MIARVAVTAIAVVFAAHPLAAAENNPLTRAVPLVDASSACMGVSPAFTMYSSSRCSKYP